MKRKVDLFEYNDNDGVGRLRTTTPSQEIAIAEKLEANMMTKAQFNALAEERKANRGGSGFDEWGKHYYNTSSNPNVNEGIWTVPSTSNTFCIGREADSIGISKTRYPVGIVNGTVLKIEKVNVINTAQNNILLPTAPTIYPYDAVLTTEQINSGVIKHADSSNSWLIVNGKFDTDTSGWTNHYPASTIESIGGMLKATNVGGAYAGVRTIIPTIIGKTYIMEVDTGVFSGASIIYGIGTTVGIDNIKAGGFGNSNQKYKVEFTATSTTTHILVRTSNNTVGNYVQIDNIAVYPADAISRSDLVFLESWHEDISGKNFVYPLGNTQYLGGNTDGLTGITNGNFTGFETYSLFGNWQTPSALIGKGYVWSNLTEAQKRSFIANPENNCYLDGDKVIQVRYRVRVVQGWSDEWFSINNSSAGAYIQQASGSYIKPKGKQVYISTEYGLADSTGIFGTLASNYVKGLTDDYKTIGAFTAVQGSAIKFTIGAYEGKCYALPIALVHRKNQGMYHPVYNPNGTKKASDSNFWYNTSVSFTSISDCFDPAKLLTESGYIGTVSGRPDGLFYDQVHEGDITDLRNSSKKVEDYNRLISREFNKLVAGTTRGKEGEWINILNGTFTATASSSSIFYFTTIQPSWWTTSASGTVVYDDNIEAHVIFAGNGYRTKSRLYASGSGYGLILGVPITVGQSATIVISIKSTRTKSNTLLHCDIIGNPANYPTSWKESGVFGTPLIVAEDGTSLLPDGVKDSFKLSRKANATPLLCLRSTDSGATWTSFTPTFSTTTNAITLTDEPAGNLVMVYYQTHTSMAVPVANSEVLEIEWTANMLHNYAPGSGACLVDTLIGMTPISGGFASMKQSISSFGIYPTNNRLYSSTPPTHNQILPINGIVPAVKVFPYLTRLNGKAYLNLVFKEMKHNGTSWGDDNKFNIVDNVSITTDNNAQTVLVGQKTVELPYFIGADE